MKSRIDMKFGFLMRKLFICRIFLSSGETLDWLVKEIVNQSLTVLK